MKHIISKKINDVEEDDFGFLEMIIIKNLLEEQQTNIN